MPVTVDEVRRIASLAGLRLSPEQERELVPQLAEIVRFAGEMEEGAPLPASPAAMGEPPGAPGPPEAPDGPAPDEPAASLDRRLVLANAPDHRDAHVRLPAVHPPEEP